VIKQNIGVKYQSDDRVLEFHACTVYLEFFYKMSDESTRALLGLLNQQRSSAVASSVGGNQPNSTGSSSGSTNKQSGGILLNLLSAMKSAPGDADEKKDKLISETVKPTENSAAEGLRQLLTASPSKNEESYSQATVAVSKPAFPNIPLASSIQAVESSL
jgi:hypothetical protein